MTWTDVPGEIHGVQVNSGDLIFGDIDGALIIPKSKVETVLEKALEKVSEENIVRRKLEEGETLERIFSEHGIL